MDTAPVDAEGEGQKRYVAVLGYWLGGKRLELYIADKDGNRVSNTYAIGGEKLLIIWNKQMHLKIQDLFL